MLFSSIVLYLALLQPTKGDLAPREAAIQQYSPFFSPAVQHPPFFLFKRQSQCPSDHTSCSNLNAPGACCPSGTNCARDSQGNIACCPVNNYCTGIIGQTGTTGGSAASTTSVTGGYVGTITVTSTAGVTDQAQTGSATITDGAAGGGSTLPNAYYPFVYLPTSFANAAVCSSYYTSCQSASTACFQSLAGINGVTIGGMGGGTTQAGASGVVQISASSICSSLSQSACYGLRSTQCSQFGSTGATGTGLIQVGKGPRETGRAAIAYAAVAGAAVGAIGLVV